MRYIVVWVMGLVVGVVLSGLRRPLLYLLSSLSDQDTRGVWGPVIAPAFEGPWFDPPILAIAIWTGFVGLVWAASERPNLGPHLEAISQSWLKYLILWLVGLVVLLRWGFGLTMSVFPESTSSQLARFVALVPLTALWSTLVFLMLLHTTEANADGQGFFETYLSPFRPVLTSFVVILMAVVITNYFAFENVKARVDGLTAARILADQTVDNLWDSAGTLVTMAETAHWDIEAYQSLLLAPASRVPPDDLDEIMQQAPIDEKDSRARSRTVIQQAPPNNALNIVIESAGDLKSPALDVMRQAKTAEIQVAYAVSSENDQRRNSAPVLEGTPSDPTRDALSAELTQIGSIVDQVALSSEALSSPVAGVDAILEILQQVPPGSAPDPNVLDDLDVEIGNIRSIAVTIRSNAGVAGLSFDGVEINDLSMFIWTGSLYSALVLFPWILLLLFLYRKRDDRAVQIIEDLELLDATGNLLERALGRQATPSPQGLAKDPQVNALIVRAFGNIEYVLSVILLTIFSAVGWYYVLYPGAFLGLTHLIRQGSGVAELTEYLGTNATPLTFGFLGAYFFVSQMLLRRYLSLDLYPSAFLQAAERIIRVFILSLLITVVAPANELWMLFASAFAFLAGVFPPWAQQAITKFVNSRMLTEFPEQVDRSPLTMLDGVNIWADARLFEEGVESVQGMATVGIEALVVGTSYPAARIVDWVDQAILLIHCQANPALEKGLHAAGVRGASDLMDAAGMNLLDLKALAEQDFVPDATHLELLLSAINTSGQRDGNMGGPIAMDQLEELCDVVWPSPNLQYVLSYISQVAKRLPGVSGAP